MENTPDFFDLENLAFFCKVNASISHELKNIMAIISETAGLLTDISEMAGKGSPIELDMLTESTQSIVEEIQRGFTTIRQMNRFSHSIDTPIVSIDLRKILDLVSHLLGYLSFSGEICVHPVEEDVPMALTCPFILQTIIYEAAAHIFRIGGVETKLNIHLRPKGDSAWQIIFDGLNTTHLESFPDESLERIAASIGVTIKCNPDTDSLDIEVPVSPQTLVAYSESSDTPVGKNNA